MTITEFLMARIAADEEAVRVFPGRRWTFDGGDVRDDVTDNPYVPWGRTVLSIGFEGECQSGIEAHVARYDPARVLAECAAKRKILELHRPITQHWWSEQVPVEVCEMCDEEEWACETVSALVAVYSDHPDYRQEWAL